LLQHGLLLLLLQDVLLLLLLQYGLLLQHGLLLLMQLLYKLQLWSERWWCSLLRPVVQQPCSPGLHHLADSGLTWTRWWQHFQLQQLLTCTGSIRAQWLKLLQAQAHLLLLLLLMCLLCHRRKQLLLLLLLL
jgi:hypothetical protein